MIRNVQAGDAERIAEIYRYYVEETCVTFEMEPPSGLEMERRIAHYTQEYPWLIWEEEGGVIGYAYAAPYRERPAWRPTAVVSVYFHKDFRGGGRGAIIMDRLLEELTARGYHTAAAEIAVPNPLSERLFRSLGFERCGFLEQSGYKMDRWLDVATYVIRLEK